MTAASTRSRFTRSLSAAGLAVIAGWCATAARAEGPNSNAPPNDPETELRAFKVADGFEVSLFASEPMLTKPIGINFDAQGRLWVASSQTYPQVKPGDVPNDKIYVLEDTDGDGKADKSTIFAEGLFLPTAVEIGDGGVYVTDSTQILHLKDTNGDGKADERKVILSGFGTEDTHHVIHGFRWDFGGRLNFLQGIYIGSRVETPAGTKVGLASTLWQFRPETMDLSQYCTGLVNPWGVTWDRYGQMFLTDGAGGEGVNFAPPGAQFTAAYGADNVLKGLNPGSPKYSAAQILDGRHIPADWQGDLITNDFRANRTVRFKLTPDGSGFSAKLMPDLIVSADRAYRPIDVKMGPDGAIYIADWYNPIINHGEVDFRDPRRDKSHGRIWRVTAKGKPTLPRPKIIGATPDELAAMLTSPEQWTRLQAKLQLRALGTTVAEPALRRWIKSGDLGSPGVAHDQALLEGLWAFETLDVPEPKLLDMVLKASTPEVRAAAVRVAGHWAARMDGAVAKIAPFAADEFPRVRLEAVCALHEAGASAHSPAVVPLALAAMDKPVDPVIAFALYQLLSDMKDLWLPAATSGSLEFGNATHLAYAMRVVKSADALKKTVADLKSGAIPPSGRKDAYDLIALLGTPDDLGALLTESTKPGVDVPNRVAAMSALERAIRQRKLKPTGIGAQVMAQWLADPSAAVQEAAIRLAGPYRSMSAKAKLEGKLTEAATPPSMRMAAAQALAELPAADVLTAHAGADQPAPVRSAAIAGLAGVNVKSAATFAADFLTTAKPQDDPAPVLGAFLKRDGGIEALAAELKGKKIPADTAKLSLRYVQGVGVELGQLGEVIRTSAGAGGGGAIQLPPDAMKKLIDEVAATGDPSRGEMIFRSKATGCMQCHMIGGVGGQLAPDLRAIGASAPVDYIVDSILVPAKAVKDGYAATIVTTKDKELIQGIKVREDAKELVLRDNVRDEIVVVKDDIKERKEGGTLMPAGLTDGLTHQEFVDLVRFLSELGKPGAYSVPTGPVVRRWRMLDPVTDDAAASAPPAAADATNFWPLYAKVGGEVPLTDLAASPQKKIAFVRFEFAASDAGAVRLVFNSAKGLTAWIDDKPVSLAAADAPIQVAKGIRTATVRVDLAVRGNEPLEVQTVETAGSNARMTPVVGR